MTDTMLLAAVESAKPAAALSMANGVAAAEDPEAVMRFARALNGACGEEPPFLGRLAHAWSDAYGNHQGIIHRMKALSELGQMSSPSLAQLTELQYEVHNLAFQQEVVAKVADKISQGIQTLVKNQ
ncbi:MAG: hypothetical protein J6S30_00660 [Kiritimatiellae bacterium]|nr:hypothetical protein [Kiritimatiellia bacterium]